MLGIGNVTGDSAPIGTWIWCCRCHTVAYKATREILRYEVVQAAHLERVGDYPEPRQGDVITCLVCKSGDFEAHVPGDGEEMQVYEASRLGGEE